MAQAAIILSKEGIVLYNNPSLLRLIESPEAIVGTSFLDLIQESDRQYFIDFLHQKKKDKTELSIVTKQQNTQRISVSGSEIIWNESEDWCLLLLDITQTKKAQRLIEVTEGLARILSMDITLQMASQFMLELLNNYFGWEVLIIWIWNTEKHKLQCAQISHIPGINIDKLLTDENLTILLNK